MPQRSGPLGYEREWVSSATSSAGRKFRSGIPACSIECQQCTKRTFVCQAEVSIASVLLNIGGFGVDGYVEEERACARVLSVGGLHILFQHENAIRSLPKLSRNTR